MKKIVLITMVCFLFLGTGFGYLEENFFCILKKDDIRISLKKSDGNRCSEYIKTIEQSMKNNYKDILIIQWYIDKKQNLGYRKQIKQEKIKKINDLQDFRLKLKNSMKMFEDNLLKKYQEFFLDSINLYKWKLKRTLFNLNNLSWTVWNTYLQKYTAPVQQQLDTIQKISETTGFRELLVLVNKYVYLKKQMEWKSD